MKQEKRGLHRLSYDSPGIAKRLYPFGKIRINALSVRLYANGEALASQHDAKTKQKSVNPSSYG